MNGCDRWNNEIDRFLDGELTAPDAAAFEAHLASCPACADVIEARRWLTDQLAALPRPEVSPQFEARFWARIAREDDEKAANWLERIARGLRIRWAVPATLIAVLSLWFSLSPEPRTEVGTELALTQWEILEDPDEFELLASEELELFALLDVLEDWDGTEEI